MRVLLYGAQQAHPTDRISLLHIIDFKLYKGVFTSLVGMARRKAHDPRSAAESFSFFKKVLNIFVQQLAKKSLKACQAITDTRRFSSLTG